MARLALGLRLSALGLIIIFYLSIVFNSAMVNDDYMAMYTIWRMSIGHVAGVDFNVDSYTLLFDLLTPIASLIGPRFELIFLFRAIILLMLALISWQLFYLLQVIVNKNISLIAVLFLLICTPMYQRGLDLRPDLFILALWLQIIIIFSSKDAILSSINIFCVGVLISIGFLFKFKSIIIVLPLALFFMHQMIIERRNLRLVMRAIVYLALGMALVFIPYAWMLGFDTVLQGYVAVTAKLMESSLNGEISVVGLKLAVFKQAFSQDALFWIFTFTGAVLLLVRKTRLSINKRMCIYYLLILGLASVVFNPHYHAYNLASLSPLVLVLVALTLQVLFELLPKASHLFNALCIVFSAVYVSVTLFNFYSYAVSDRLSHQAALNKFILENTEAEQAIFAYEGIGLFRPSTFHWRTSKIKLAQYVQGDYDLWQEIKAAKPVLIILNYRLPHWLIARDTQALFDHYLVIAPQLMAPGISSLQQGETRLILSGAYRIRNTWGKACKLDGLWVEDGTILIRHAGKAELEAAKGGECTLIWAFTQSSIDSLVLSNPNGYAYLLRSTIRVKPTN